MAESSPTEYFIQGITKNGRKFRPSDWSERLCGVMSGFGPRAKGPNARLQYSIYVRPTMIGDIKVVIVDSRLRDVEPMAFDFVLNFAKDNDLVVTEACELPPALMANATAEPGGYWRIPIEDIAHVEQALARLREAGASVASLEVAEPELEEVFLRIMRRDEAA